MVPESMIGLRKILELVKTVYNSFQETYCMSPENIKRYRIMIAEALRDTPFCYKFYNEKHKRLAVDCKPYRGTDSMPVLTVLHFSATTYDSSVMGPWLDLLPRHLCCKFPLFPHLISIQSLYHKVNCSVSRVSLQDTIGPMALSDVYLMQPV